MRRADGGEVLMDEELAVLAELGRCPGCGRAREVPAPFIECEAFHSVPADESADASPDDPGAPSASEPSSNDDDEQPEASKDPDGPSVADAIPAELRARVAWVCWRYEERNGRRTKVPYTPGGTKASPTDALTWSNFEAVHISTGFDGIGFVFSTGDPLFGIDLDRAFDEHGFLKPWAAEIVQAFAGRAYLEYSPSGTGLHIIGKGKVPQGRRAKIEDGEIEIYSSERYFTVTGKPYEGPVAR